MMKNNIPDNKYSWRLYEWRAGTRKQDLCEIGGIILACQVGIEKFENEFKKKNTLESVFNGTG